MPDPECLSDVRAFFSVAPIAARPPDLPPKERVWPCTRAPDSRSTLPPKATASPPTTACGPSCTLPPKATASFRTRPLMRRLPP